MGAYKEFIAFCYRGVLDLLAKAFDSAQNMRFTTHMSVHRSTCMFVHKKGHP